jgi:hypothetical protein
MNGVRKVTSPDERNSRFFSWSVCLSLHERSIMTSHFLTSRRGCYLCVLHQVSHPVEFSLIYFPPVDLDFSLKDFPPTSSEVVLTFLPFTPWPWPFCPFTPPPVFVFPVDVERSSDRGGDDDEGQRAMIGGLSVDWNEIICRVLVCVERTRKPLELWWSLSHWGGILGILTIPGILTWPIPDRVTTHISYHALPCVIVMTLDTLWAEGPRHLRVTRHRQSTGTTSTDRRRKQPS